MTSKELREMNRLSQREFASMIGISQAAVNKWERQEVKISKEHQERIDLIFKLKRKVARATSYDLGV